MKERCRPWCRSARIGWPVLALLLLGSVVQATPPHEDVHKADANCAACHTATRVLLEQDPAAARAQLQPDVDERCNTCHGDEGPSHRVGIAPHATLPETLPLSSSGTIMCATCHFMHGERNPFGDFVRVDNSRGALCLTCHKLEELQ